MASLLLDLLTVALSLLALALSRLSRQGADRRRTHRNWEEEDFR